MSDVLVHVDVIYSGAFVELFQENGYRVALWKRIFPLPSCVNIGNRAEFVALSEAGVVLPKSCCQASPPVEFVIVYARLSSMFVPLDNAKTEFLPSAFGEPEVIKLFAEANPFDQIAPLK